MLLVSEITVPISSVLPPPSKTGCRFQALKLHCLCLVSLFQRPQPNYLHLVVVVADAQGPGDALLSPPSSFFSPRREPSEDRRSLLAAAECPSCAAGEVRPALRGHRCRSASQFPSPCRRCRRVLSSPLLPELVASQQELRHSSFHVTSSAALARARERSGVGRWAWYLRTTSAEEKEEEEEEEMFADGGATAAAGVIVVTASDCCRRATPSFPRRRRPPPQKTQGMASPRWRGRCWSPRSSSRARSPRASSSRGRGRRGRSYGRQRLALLVAAGRCRSAPSLPFSQMLSMPLPSFPCTSSSKTSPYAVEAAVAAAVERGMNEA